MKIYVAASSREMDRASVAFELVKACPDLELAHDWIAQIKAVGAANPPAANYLRRQWALKDLEAVKAAPIFWFLLPTTETVGAWCELTAAAVFDMSQRGPKRLIVTSGNDSMRSIFSALAHRHYQTDSEAFSALKIYAARLDFPGSSHR